MADLPAIPEAAASDFASVVDGTEPKVIRGLVAAWPAAAVGNSPEEFRSYLLRFDRGTPVEAYVAPPEAKGRFFYSDDMTGFNFERGYLRLGDATAMMIAEGSKERQRGIYAGSAPIKQVIPDFERENAIPGLNGKPAEARIWLGNETVVAAHWDSSNNVACVIAGRRRFTLFPPGQVRNLYVGPLDKTISGPPASLVDFRNPDFEKFPRFREALAAAMSAELEPGDAIYIPALWWHHVEALSPLNALVNYWWQDGPPDAGAALASVAHGILTISALPEAQRDAWREMFDYYVFRRHGDPGEHIPPQARGALSESSPAIRRGIKEFLIRVLSQS